VNTMMLWTWRGQEKRGGAWMQAMHFGFSAGATVAPLAIRGSQSGGMGVAPAYVVVGVVACCVAIMLALLPSPPPPPPTTSHASESSTADSTRATEGDGTSLKAADGACVVDSTAMDAGKPRGDEADQTPPPGTSAASSPAHMGRGKCGMWRRRLHAAAADPLERAQWVAVVLGALLLALYVGAEHTFGNLATAFVVVQLRQPESDGQYLTSAYWGAMTVGRFASVWLSLKCRPRTLLFAATTASALAAVGLLAGQGSIGAVWVFAVAFGFCMAPQFPTVFALAGLYVPFRGRHTAVLSVFNSLGAWALPMAAASLFTTAPGGMLWIVLLASVINMAVAVAFDRAARHAGGQLAAAATAR